MSLEAFQRRKISDPLDRMEKNPQKCTPISEVGKIFDHMQTNFGWVVYVFTLDLPCRSPWKPKRGKYKKEKKETKKEKKRENDERKAQTKES